MLGEANALAATLLAWSASLDNDGHAGPSGDTQARHAGPTFEEMKKQFPKGSSWYAYGYHWKIEDHAWRDGQPAVVTRLPGKKVRATVVARIFARKAVPS